MTPESSDAATLISAVASGEGCGTGVWPNIAAGLVLSSPISRPRARIHFPFFVLPGGHRGPPLAVFITDIGTTLKVRAQRTRVADPTMLAG